MTNYYTLRVHNAEIKDLWRKRSLFKGRFTRPSPYVKISVGDLVQRSSIAEKTVVPTWDDELPILCSGSGPKINIEILQDSVLAKGEYLYRPDNENERSEAKLRVDLRSHKDKIIKSSSFIMFGINPSDANGIAELAIKKLIQAVYGNNDEASTVDEMVQKGVAGYQSDLASLFKESTPFVDVFMKNMDELAGAHPYLKLAWSVTSVAYKAVHSQIEFDKQVKELIEELVRTFRVIRDAAQIRRPLESFTAATSELLDLVIRLCIFIREYIRRDFIGRTLHVNDRAVITEFRTKLGTLKTNLDEAFSRQNVAISSRVADDALLKRLEHDLNPVYMSNEDRPECLDGTRVDLLQEIERWIYDKDQPNIFLLTGGAGTGKSTVASTIAERYRLRMQLGCHLFFTRGKSDPKSVIRTMAYRLASLSQTIAENIADSVRDHGEIKTATLLSQFKVLLHDPLHSSAQKESDDPILIVLDALDECGTKTTQMTLLQILKKELPTLPVKYRFLLTSRPEGTVLSFLPLPTVHSAILDSNAQNSKDDVRTYINSELQNFQEDGLLNVPDDWPLEYYTKRLEEAADGLFIWASTALKFIKEKNSNRFMYFKELVNNTKVLDLNELYETVLKSSLEWGKYTEVFPNIFSLIFFGKCPLTDTEIDGILDLDKGTTDSILVELRSLVKYERGQPIQFHHASFYDYLTSCKGKRWFIDTGLQKELIVIECFERMKGLLRFNICDLESSLFFNRDIPDLQERIQRNIPLYLQYICNNWVFHLRDVSFSHNLCEYIQIFAHSQLLFWFEVLSLTGTFNGIVGTALLYTIAWIGSQNMQLSAFLRDAYRQTCTFSAPISQSTLHIYSSLLPIMKGRSTVMKHYSVYSNPASQVDYNGSIPLTTFTKEIRGEKGYIWFNSASISPDGTRVATASKVRADVSIWDATSSKIIIGPLEGHSSSITTVTFSSDGKYIASGFRNGSITVWDAANGEFVLPPLHGHTDRVTSVAFSSDGKRIASGSLDKIVRLWNVEGGSPIGEPLTGHTDSVESISFPSEGSLIASGSKDKSIIIWDVQKFRMHLDPFRKHSDIVSSVSFSPDGKYVVSGSHDGFAYMWKSSSGEIVREFHKHSTFKVACVAYTPDGLHILTGYSDGMIRIWDISENSAPPRQFRAHSGYITDISFARDNTRFVTNAHFDRTRVWDLTDDLFVSNPSERQPGMIRSIAISPSKKYIVSGSNKNTICVWNAATGELVSGPWMGHTQWVTSVVFSPDETKIASGSVDSTVKLWDVVGGVSIELVGHTSGVMSVVFSPNGEHIATSSRDKTIRVWDTRTGEMLLQPFEGHDDDVQSIAYSQDGTKIVSGSFDTTVRIWSSTSGQLLSILRGHDLLVHSVAISPDGNCIASGSGSLTSYDSGKIIAWDTKSGEILFGPLARHNSVVSSLCYSPDGRWILSGSHDTTICLSDATTGDLFRLFKGHTGPVTSVQFFPNGRHFASSSDDETIRTWTLDSNTSNIGWQQRNKEGWVIGEKGELLIWLPPDLRVTHSTPGTIAIFNQSLRIKLSFRKEEKWTRYLPYF